MNEVQRQRDLELTMIQRGIARFMDEVNTNEEKGRRLDNPAERKLVQDMLRNLIPAIKSHQRTARSKLVAAQTDGRRLSGWELPFALSSPEVMAYVTIRRTLGSSDPVRAKHTLGRAIGASVNQELQWQELRDAERERAKDNPPNRLAYLKRTVKDINPKSLRKWLRRMDDIQTTEWDNQTRLRVGIELLALLAEACGDYVDVTTIRRSYGGRKATTVSVRLHPEVEAVLRERTASLAASGPFLLPMVSPPVPWEVTPDGVTGGYFTIRHPIIKKGFQRHTADLDPFEAVSPQVVRALNAVSATGWRINKRVLRVAEQVVEEGTPGLCPVPPVVEPPPRLPDEEWDAMSPSARAEFMQVKREAYDDNNKLAAKRDAIHRALSIAREFENEKAIYFPHNLDFRGRAYPMPQDLHPQGSHFIRALLRFSERKRLGSLGLAWLAYAAASAWGLDKVSRNVQMEWVSRAETQDIIRFVATDPLGAGLEFLQQADEPWDFLAVCMELDAAFTCPEGTANYMTSLPIQVDGTCNGLQHLSAMGRDAAGATATNLTKSKERQDIYQIVADRVLKQCKKDAKKKLPEAKWWAENVTRSTVKRGVMTTPYGVTPLGIRDQLIKDGFTQDPERADYLRDVMVDSIASVVKAASEIMEWLQGNAHILAYHNQPVTWETPSGMVVRQAYRNYPRKRINTLLGRTYLTDSDDQTAPLMIRKQAASISPNLIHSFDAAHMTNTINHCLDQGIISAFSVIHDSFGTHAPDVAQLVSNLKLEFYAIYQYDWFNKIQRNLEATAGPNVSLLPPPKMGAFDVREVLESEYLFS